MLVYYVFGSVYTASQHDLGTVSPICDLVQELLKFISFVDIANLQKRRWPTGHKMAASRRFWIITRSFSMICVLVELHVHCGVALALYGNTCITKSVKCPC